MSQCQLLLRGALHLQSVGLCRFGDWVKVQLVTLGLKRQTISIASNTSILPASGLATLYCDGAYRDRRKQSKYNITNYRTRLLVFNFGPDHRARLVVSTPHTSASPRES